MQILRIQTPPTRLPLSSANEDSPSLKASLFPLRLQGFNRVGLCNPLGENQPSLSRRSKLFAMSPVGYGLSHFAVGDFQAFGRSQYLPLQHGSTSLQARYFPSHALPRWHHRVKSR